MCIFITIIGNPYIQSLDVVPAVDFYQMQLKKDKMLCTISMHYDAMYTYV